MTTWTNTPWECSPAYDQWSSEARHYVARQLEEWGSHRNSEWPDGARFVNITEPQMTPAWFYQIVHLGKAGIMKQIPGWKLAELFPQKTWREWTHDVYFVEATNGNVHKETHSRTLCAYIVGDNYVRVVTLGCAHPNEIINRTSGQYTEHHCPDCGYRWGVDTSG